ncbi:MAG: hypothetical protein ACXWLS_06390 [Myxococcaceae bacterium]
MTSLRRAALVLLLSAAAIELHELGHRCVFWLTGTPARMGFQRVDPTVPVSEAVRLWGKAGGPLLTLVLAVVFLAMARRRPSFGWSTAAFTQASLRLLPLSFDLLRAIHGTRPFSDEGDLALAVSSSPSIRTALVLAAWLLFGGLSFVAARTYPVVRRKRWPVVLAVYLGSLVVGIAAVLGDELLGVHGS